MRMLRLTGVKRRARKRESTSQKNPIKQLRFLKIRARFAKLATKVVACAGERRFQEYLPTEKGGWPRFRKLHPQCMRQHYSSQRLPRQALASEAPLPCAAGRPF